MNEEVTITRSEAGLLWWILDNVKIGSPETIHEALFGFASEDHAMLEDLTLKLLNYWEEEDE